MVQFFLNQSYALLALGRDNLFVIRKIPFHQLTVYADGVARFLWHVEFGVCFSHRYLHFPFGGQQSLQLGHRLGGQDKLRFGSSFNFLLHQRQSSSIGGHQRQSLGFGHDVDAVERVA